MRRKLAFSETDLSWMEAWYRDGYSTGQIAQAFDCLMGSVWARLKKRGVPMRRARGKRGYRWHSNGYLLHAGRYEHRVVAERMLGRPLGAGEVVHHKNHDRADNRPENLEILSSHAAHMRQHDYRAWTREQEQRLLDSLAAGLSTARIAQVIGKTPAAVRNRVRRLQRRGVLPRFRVGRKPSSRGEVLP